MNNGGYIMVDMTGWTVGTAGEIPGIYKRLADALKTGKQIILSGVTDGGGVMAPFSALVKRGITTISITYDGGTYDIDIDDSISS